MNIPADVRQFGLKQLLLAIVSFSVAFALLNYVPDLGRGAVAAVAAFWFGFLCLIVSDSIDNGPIDERRLGSQIFNLFGVLCVLVGFLGGIAVLLICVVVGSFHFFPSLSNR